MSEPEGATTPDGPDPAAEEEAPPLYPVPMTDLISGREDGTNVIVSTGPDVCLTPVGSSLVPVAYSSVAFAGDSTRLSPTVLDNECADFHLNSRICTSTGHEPGVGAGVAVPGYQGEAFVQTASPTVFTDGWATTRHRDPAMINRPGSGAVEPQFERTSYWDQVVARVQGRGEAESLDICYASDVEANLPSRDVEPGTNVSVESGNGAAMLLTGATAPPEEDYGRQPGETREEYFARIRAATDGRPRGDAGLQSRVTDIEGYTAGVTSDRDFGAWQQSIPAELYHDPLGQPGVSLDELNTETARLVTASGGDPIDVMGPMLGTHSFIGADGNVYNLAPNGQAGVWGSDPSDVNALLGSLDQQYILQRERLGEPVSEDYRLSDAIPLMLNMDGTVGPRPGMAVAQPPPPARGQPAQPVMPLFSQSTATPVFQNGPFQGQTIGQVAAGLRSGAISPSQLPLDIITRNGETLSMNTRSLLALRRAGIPASRFVTRNVTGVPFFENLLTQRLASPGNRALGGRGSPTIRITGAGVPRTSSFF